MDYMLGVASGETPGKPASYSPSGRVNASSDHWVRPVLYITAASVSILGAAYLCSSSSVSTPAHLSSQQRKALLATHLDRLAHRGPANLARTVRTRLAAALGPATSHALWGDAAAAALPAGSGLAPGLQGPSGADRESVLSALASATEGFSAEQLRGLVGAALVLGPMAAVEAQVQELEQGLKAWEASRTALTAVGPLAAITHPAAALVRRADALARALPPLTPEHLRQALRQAQAARLLGLK
ncbi:hypothetical protein HYH03_009079 [Edaphochlamys debaryana]|uniref:Uncharacterized protein n=1 Tax=Edaphochlamys debaryana TaxID=47281 RepID=A0A835Y7Y5_9CHLO|nr:hypothetical protein HYH03_009079 [Edaphochlamys debaryana]|eukprot:KAG2492664.1 hypothetical protein HYH03_009079 [Edaphochlamys debaryana]